MLRRCLVVVSSLLFLLLAARQGLAADWHAVTGEETKMTAADTGDPEADAAIAAAAPQWFADPALVTLGDR